MKKQIILVVAVVVGLVVVLKFVDFNSPSAENPTGGIEFNTGKVVYSELAESVLQRRTVVLTQAQINDLSNDENGI